MVSPVHIDVLRLLVAQHNKHSWVLHLLHLLVELRIHILDQVSMCPITITLLLVRLVATMVQLIHMVMG